MTKPIQIKNLIIGSGIPKICVPLTASDKETLCREAEAAKAAGADLVEWRADFFEGLSDNDAVLETLRKLRGVLEETPLLFTIRTNAEGGNVDISPEEYRDRNLTAAESGCVDLVDVEVFGDMPKRTLLVHELQEAGTKVIASSHDFRKTDDQETLVNRFREMDTTGADILKMAVMPDGFGDAEAIMLATNRMRKEFTEKPLISMAMGMDGFITRISGENFGSSVTFGTVGKASAPGQIPVWELRNMLQVLHEKNEEGER